ncbi:hypothetical protein ACP4OV_024738 [Aristida adscensionis]
MPQRSSDYILAKFTRSHKNWRGGWFYIRNVESALYPGCRLPEFNFQLFEAVQPSWDWGAGEKERGKLGNHLRALAILRDRGLTAAGVIAEYQVRGIAPLMAREVRLDRMPGGRPVAGTSLTLEEIEEEKVVRRLSDALDYSFHGAEYQYPVPGCPKMLPDPATFRFRGADALAERPGKLPKSADQRAANRARAEAEREASKKRKAEKAKKAHRKMLKDQGKIPMDQTSEEEEEEEGDDDDVSDEDIAGGRVASPAPVSPVEGKGKGPMWAPPPVASPVSEGEEEEMEEMEESTDRLLDQMFGDNSVWERGDPAAVGTTGGEAGGSGEADSLPQVVPPAAEDPPAVAGSTTHVADPVVTAQAVDAPAVSAGAAAAQPAEPASGAVVGAACSGALAEPVATAAVAASPTAPVSADVPSAGRATEPSDEAATGAAPPTQAAATAGIGPATLVVPSAGTAPATAAPTPGGSRPPTRASPSVGKGSVAKRQGSRSLWTDLSATTGSAAPVVTDPRARPKARSVGGSSAAGASASAVPEPVPGEVAHGAPPPPPTPSATGLDARKGDGRGFMSERLEWPDPLQPNTAVVVDDPREAAKWAGFEDVMAVVQSSITTAARALNDTVNPFRDLESCSRLKSVLLARHRSALCDVAARRGREAELEARVAALEAEKALWTAERCQLQVEWEKMLAERHDSRAEASRLRTSRDVARKERLDALKVRDEALSARDAAVLTAEAKDEELKKAEGALAALRDRADAAVATAKSREAEAEGYKKVVDQVRVGLERLGDVATQVCDSLGVPAQTGAADVSARVAQIVPRVGELELEAFRMGSQTVTPGFSKNRMNVISKYHYSNLNLSPPGSELHAVDVHRVPLE